MSTLNPDLSRVAPTSDEGDHEDRRNVVPPETTAAPTDDRVLALRPVSASTPRLPNQHDLLNIDDDELFRRPTFEDAAWVDFDDIERAVNR